jgi:hypothetical protein
MNRLKIGGAMQRSLIWALLRGAVLSPHYNLYDFAGAKTIKHLMFMAPYILVMYMFD